MKIFIRENFSDQKTNNRAGISGLWKLEYIRASR